MIHFSTEEHHNYLVFNLILGDGGGLFKRNNLIKEVIF